MFCSLCKAFEEVRDCQRKICPLGHVACEICDENLENCPECDFKFSSFVCVQFQKDVPRLFFAHFPREQLAGEPQEETNQAPNSSTGSESIEQIINEIKVYDEQRNDIEVDCNARSVFGCFEVVSPNPSSSFAIDGEDEKEIMNCFQTINRTLSSNEGFVEGLIEKETNNEASLVTSSNVLSAHPTEVKSLYQSVTHREVQTSVMHVVEKGTGFALNLSISQSSSSSNHLQAKYNNSSCNYYPSQEDYEAITSTSESVDEIFKNELVEDSETAHFTSRTVSKNWPSPPISPPRKGVRSLGCRVKYSSVFGVDEHIPAQMEPLNFNDVVSDMSKKLPSDCSRKLPRFPVRCPITNCGMCSVPSDFCNHVIIDHPHVDVLKISPGKLINLKINQKVNSNMVVCQRLFLLTDKITDIGYGAFENCVPVVLLSTKMSLCKAFSCSITEKASPDEHLFVFLVGVYQFPINYTITLWSHGRDDYEPTVIKSMTNSIFFMNKPFCPKIISGNALAISQLELQKLTNDGSKMLSCQILFH